MAKTKAKILVVDDNAGIRGALRVLLPLHFTDVELIPSPKELMSKIREFQPSAVLLDMNFYTDINTGNEGLYWLAEIKKVFPSIEVVLFTAYADIQLAVEGMKRGAFDFIVKPWDNQKLVEILSKAVQKNQKEKKPAVPSNSLLPDKMLWGTTPQMQTIRRTVEKIAPTDATVLITGENGTGKDVLAGEIYRLSSRAAGPMVSVDVGALTESLFESELFGHVKGYDFLRGIAVMVGKRPGQHQIRPQRGEEMLKTGGYSNGGQRRNFHSPQFFQRSLIAPVVNMLNIFGLMTAFNDFRPAVVPPQKGFQVPQFGTAV